MKWTVFPHQCLKTSRAERRLLLLQNMLKLLSESLKVWVTFIKCKSLNILDSYFTSLKRMTTSCTGWAWKSEEYIFYFQIKRNQRGDPGERGGVRDCCCCSLLYQETNHPEASGGWKCCVWMSDWGKPQTTHHLEEEWCSTHYRIQVSNTCAQVFTVLTWETVVVYVIYILSDVWMQL